MQTGQGLAGSRRELWRRKLVYPGHTLPTAIAPVLVAIGLAVHDHVFSAAAVALAFVAGWLIQFAGVVVDNYENLVHQPDDPEHPELVDAVRTGLISLDGLRKTATACYVLAVAAGTALYVIAGWPVVVIGLLSILASWLYSAGPLPIGRIGLADPLFFLFFGTVSVMGAYFVQVAASMNASGEQITWSAAFPLEALVLSLPIGAMITGILIIDDIRDRDFDVVKGKNTIAVRLGKSWSRAEWAVITALSYVAPLWFWLAFDFGPWVLLPMLTVPFALAVARELFRRETYLELLPMTPRAAQLVLAYAALLALGVALS